MNGSRFDGITRALATETTRRRALLGVGSGAFAGLLAHLGVEEAAAGCVKPGKKGCKGPKNGKCCDGARCQGGTNTKAGRCVCTGSLKKCGDECVNTTKDKRHCGSCNKTCKGSLSCTGGQCRTKLGCRAGDQYCNNVGVNCPDTDNPNCRCLTDVHGTPRCSDLSDAICTICTTNAGCGPGRVCFPANIGVCACHEHTQSNGNACAAATCDGINGSGAGRGVRSPLLR